MKQITEVNEIPKNGWLLNYVYDVTADHVYQLPDISIMQIVNGILSFKSGISLCRTPDQNLVVHDVEVDADYDYIEYAEAFFSVEGDEHFILTDDEVVFNVLVAGI